MSTVSGLIASSNKRAILVKEEKQKADSRSGRLDDSDNTLTADTVVDRLRGEVVTSGFVNTKQQMEFTPSIISDEAASRRKGRRLHDWMILQRVVSGSMNSIPLSISQNP